VYSRELADCQYKTARCPSTIRLAHDAKVEDIMSKVEDILCMLDILDNSNVLYRNRYTAMSFDTLPRYGSNEINICAVVNRPLNADNDFAQLKDKLNIFSTDRAVISTCLLI